MFSQLYYSNIVRDHLIEKFLIQKDSQVPFLEKISISGGIKKQTKNLKKVLITAYSIELSFLKKPVLRKSKKSVSSFGIREDSISGFENSFSKNKSLECVFTLGTLILPNLKDFSSFQKHNFVKMNNSKWNLELGFNNCLMFPQTDEQYELFSIPVGYNISCVIKSHSLLESICLLSHFQFKIR